MHSRVFGLIVVICLIVFPFYPLAEAKPSIDLQFYKNNGYGVGDDIGGVWTVTAAVSSDVQYVEFYLDEQLQKNDTSAPFNWQFDTSNYTAGSHSIKAVAYDSVGESSFLQVTRNFQETSTEVITTVIVGVAVAIFAVAAVFAFYKVRKAKR